MANSPEFQSTQMKKNQMRRTYLIAYSRADLELFPTCESFGLAIAEAFDSDTNKVKVVYWASALENHQDGRKHYHVVLKSSGPKRWLSVKNVLSTRYYIVVNFSKLHDNYYSGYKYITKADTEVFHSGEHPNLKDDVAAKRPKLLTNFDVREFLVENQLKNSTQLFAKANEQKQVGKTDLASSVLSRSSKALNDLIENTWAMESAVEKVARSNVTCIEIKREIIRTE